MTIQGIPQFGHFHCDHCDALMTTSKVCAQLLLVVRMYKGRLSLATEIKSNQIIFYDHLCGHVTSSSSPSIYMLKIHMFVFYFYFSSNIQVHICYVIVTVLSQKQCCRILDPNNRQQAIVHSTLTGIYLCILQCRTTACLPLLLPVMAHSVIIARGKVGRCYVMMAIIGR